MVGVDLPTNALSMHIQKPYKKNCLGSHSYHFVTKMFLNQIPSCICSMCLLYIVKAKYQVAPSKAVVGVDWPV